MCPQWPLQQNHVHSTTRQWAIWQNNCTSKWVPSTSESHGWFEIISEWHEIMVAYIWRWWGSCIPYAGHSWQYESIHEGWIEEKCQQLSPLQGTVHWKIIFILQRFKVFSHLGITLLLFCSHHIPQFNWNVDSVYKMLQSEREGDAYWKVELYPKRRPIWAWLHLFDPNNIPFFPAELVLNHPNRNDSILHFFMYNPKQGCDS